MVVVSGAVLVVAQRPRATARRNVAACCPNNGQWVGAGRGSARRLFQLSHQTYPPFLLLELCVLFWDLSWSDLKCETFPFLCCSTSCFYNQPSFTLRRRRRPHCLDLYPLLRSVTPINATYCPPPHDVDSVNNICWSKRKVGPLLYVTEQGTLESATAPLADCPHAVFMTGLDTMMDKNTDNIRGESGALPQTSEDTQELHILGSFACMSGWVGTPVCSC